MKIIINVDVPELALGIEFYTNAFELKLNRILDDDTAELVGASSIIYLLQKPARSRASNTSTQDRDYGRHWTPVHIDFVVEDLEVARARVLSAGANYESECDEWMGSKCITFSDPFGHGFCLIAFKNETYRSN
jgi:predicted enzyme related to lactoylglutathione lyase